MACHVPKRLLMLVRFSLSAIRTSSRRWLSAAIAPGPSLQAEKTLGDAELARASRRDADMRANYEDVPSEYPAHAQPADPAAKVDKLEAYRKRMIYRSKQRGWLEVDLLMGSFAVKAVPSLSLEQLREYERILSCETVDLFSYVSGQKPVPEDLQGEMMTMLLDYVKTRPVGLSSPEAYASIKKVMPN